MAKQVEVPSSNGLLGTLRNNPVAQRLTDEARNLVEAQASRVVSKVGGGLTGTAERFTKAGESGQLPAIGEGAKRLLKGDGPLKSAAGAAKAGVGGKASQLLDRVKGGGSGKGTGKSKAMNVEESIDVGVPVSTAYNQWTQFKDFTRFMKGVESVEQESDTETTWRAKVFKSSRTWKAKIEEQIPDHRIVWTSEGSKGSTKGVVTFHPLSEDLTRVLLTLEYYPSGVVEKTGNLWRAAGRRARLDLKNFRRFVMMEGEETGAWRGEIREGEVTESSDEAEASASSEEEGGEEKPRRRRRASSEEEGGEEKPRRRRRASSEAASRGRGEEPSTPPRKRAPRKAQPAAKAQPAKRATRRASTASATGRASKATGGTRRASSGNGRRSGAATGTRRATKATATRSRSRS